MASTASLKRSSFLDWSKGKYEYVDTWPLMSNPAVPLLIISSYWLFVFKLGPQFMKNRPPYKLTLILALYNAAQVVLSAYMTYLASAFIWKYGLSYSTCYMDDDRMAFKINGLSWIYSTAKLTELLDTIFFVLRKKFNQISFLHVYHHSLMMIGGWAFVKYGTHDNFMFIGLVNSAVHTIMYTYYGLAAFGPVFEKYLFWKKYITKMQLIQFLVVLVHVCVAGAMNSCSLGTPQRWLIFINLGIFIYLFWDFYKSAYHKKDKLRQ